MARCDSCGEWFHDTCHSVPEKVFEREDEDWTCSSLCEYISLVCINSSQTVFVVLSGAERIANFNNTVTEKKVILVAEESSASIELVGEDPLRPVTVGEKSDKAGMYVCLCLWCALFLFFVNF